MAKDNTKNAEKELMNKLYVEYGLTPDHVFAHKFYKIITRAGIDKIQSKANIKIRYEFIDSLSKVTSNGLYVTVQAFADRYNDNGELIASVQTMGESSPDNTTNAYPVAMAEKRAMSRAVLKLAGLYEEGVFGEDEADDFSESVRKGRRSNSGSVQYKGN